MTAAEAVKEKETILVVDDTPENLAMISDLLKDDYKIKVANNGEKAIRIASGDKAPDLILLDIMMPEIDGYEVCRRLKADAKTRNIPVIFLTAKTDEADEKMGLDLGAVDYVTKPVNAPILFARIKTQLELKAAADFLKDKNRFLEEEVAARTLEVRTIQNVTVLALASLAETRDNETGYHIRRTQMYMQVIAKKLSDYPRFSDVLTDDYIELLSKSAPLHDIGKVGISDQILLKPSRLTAEEFETMKTHTTIGRDAIVSAENQLGIEVEFLKCAKEIAYSHHEKWDSSGYPDGIGGDQIPISARLMAIADVYDALVSNRVYKTSMPHDQALSIILEGKGTHFDPDIVNAFVEIRQEIKDIAGRLADPKR